MAESYKNKTAQPARVIIEDASYDRIKPVLCKVMESLDLGSWHAELSGKKVFIKPNMLGLFPPERHATTHPALIRVLTRFFRDAGAEVTVGDNCGVGGYGLNQRVGKATGIAEASEGAYKNVAKDTALTPLKSRFLDNIVVSRDMLEADVLVSVPKMKTHSLTVVTGAVKNMFGIVSGAGKGRTHGAAVSTRDFGEALADLFAIRPPDLTIMDAVVAMEGNGPSGGTPRQVGKIIASTNAVAVDALMCRIMGLDPEEVHHLRKASGRGMGPLDPEMIEVKGKIPADRGFKLPVTIQRLSFLGRFVNERFFRPMSRSRLVLDKSRCEQCGICVQGCPTGACRMDDKYPSIDEDICIRCFCCHELCPESAWQIKGLFSRFIGGGR